MTDVSDARLRVDAMLRRLHVAELAPSAPREVPTEVVDAGMLTRWLNGDEMRKIFFDDARNADGAMDPYELCQRTAPCRNGAMQCPDEIWQALLNHFQMPDGPQPPNDFFENSNTMYLERMQWLNRMCRATAGTLPMRATVMAEEALAGHVQNLNRLETLITAHLPAAERADEVAAVAAGVLDVLARTSYAQLRDMPRNALDWLVLHAGARLNTPQVRGYCSNLANTFLRNGDIALYPALVPTAIAVTQFMFSTLSVNSFNMTADDAAAMRTYLLQNHPAEWNQDEEALSWCYIVGALAAGNSNEETLREIMALVPEGQQLLVANEIILTAAKWGRYSNFDVGIHAFATRHEVPPAGPLATATGANFYRRPYQMHIASLLRIWMSTEPYRNQAESKKYFWATFFKHLNPYTYYDVDETRVQSEAHTIYSDDSKAMICSYREQVDVALREFSPYFEPETPFVLSDIFMHLVMAHRNNIIVSKVPYYVLRTHVDIGWPWSMMLRRLDRVNYYGNPHAADIRRFIEFRVLTDTISDED